MTHALQLVKKSFTWSVVVMTIAWSMGLAVLIPAGHVFSATVDPEDVEAGDLIQLQGNSAVYYVTKDMKRMFFTNSKMFHTWFTNFDALKVLPTGTDFDELYPPATPGAVAPRPASGVLMKTTVSPKVYAMGTNNTRYHLKDEAAAAALFGSNWNKKVIDVPDFILALYTLGTEWDGKTLPNGALVEKDGKTYYVWGDMLKMVDGTLSSSLAADVIKNPSAELFESREVSSDTVTVATVTADPAQGAGGGSPAAPAPTPETPATPATSAGTLTVSVNSDTPEGTFAVPNAARVPFTKIDFTASGGDVTVTSFKVKRTGSPSVNADFDKINVVNPSGDIINDTGKTLNTDDLVTFTEDIVVKSGETKTYTLVGDMASGLTGGNLPKLALQSVETTSKVVGTLPMAGNAVQTNANITLGTVTLAEGAQVGTVTEQIGDLAINFANLKITVATNDFQVEKIVLNNSGTAADEDVTGWELRYNNEKVATGVMKTKYVTFDLASCTDKCKIDKGKDKTFEVYGDIKSGSTRTVNLDVKKAVHVLVKDLKYAYYRTPTNNAGSMTNTLTISQGTLTVSKTNDVPAGNIPEDAKSIAFGSWNFKVQGEPVTVNTLVARLTFSSGSAASSSAYTSMTFYNKDGKALTGGVDAGAEAGYRAFATTTDSFTLPVGDNILTLKGNASSAPTANDTVTIAVDLNNSTNFSATGVDSGESLTLGTDVLPQAYVSGNTRTFKTSALRVTTLATPSAKTLAAGSSNVEFTHLLFDTSDSSEDIKVTQVKIEHIAGSGGKTIDIQNIRLFVDKDGDSFDATNVDTVLTVSKSGTKSTDGTDETYTFNLSGADQFTIKTGKKVKITVKADIAGGASTGATATHNLGVSTSNYVTATGLSTGTTVTEVIDTASGQVMTVGAAGGQVATSQDPSTPAAKMFAAGTQGATLAIFNFLATTTESVEIDKLFLTQRVTATASSSFKDYDLVYLVNEAGTTVGSVVPTSTKPFIDLNAGAFIIDINDSDGSKLTVKANLASIGAQQNITGGGDQIGFNIAAAADVEAIGALTGSGSTEFFGGTSPNGNTHFAFKSIPTLDVLAVGTTLTNGAVNILKFKVTANTSDLDLYKFTFDITTTGVNVTNAELFDVTDASEVSLFSSGDALASTAYLNVLFDTDSSGVGSGGEARSVAVGTPRTFVLRATTNGAATGDSVSTRIGGDSAAWVQNSNKMGTAENINSDSQNDFIWSDRSQSGHATTTNDWVNGYLVNGLASSSSTPTVVAL